MATVKIVIQKQLQTCNRVRLKPLTSLVAKGRSTTKKTTCCQLNTEGVFWEKSSQRFQQYVKEFSLGWVMKFHSGGVDNVGFRYMPVLLYMPRSVKCLRYHTPLPYYPILHLTAGLVHCYYVILTNTPPRLTREVYTVSEYIIDTRAV